MNPYIDLNLVWLRDKSTLPHWIFYSNCIYYIRNKITNEGYVGQAKSLYGRLTIGGNFSHKESFLKYLDDESNNIRLYNAIRKYGSSNFEVVLLDFDLEDLDAAEKYWISELGTHEVYGYNMTPGGNGGAVQMLTEEVQSRVLSTKESRYGNRWGIKLRLHVLSYSMEMET